MPAQAPAPLMDDLVDEVLLRFAPNEPEHLVRAALVSKHWYRLISDPGFRRRFRELHRKPPMLGVLFRCYSSFRRTTPFVPTSSVPLPHAVPGRWRPIESRHGRVLFHTGFDDHLPSWDGSFVVWVPITNERRELPRLPALFSTQLDRGWTAAVLCAAAGGGCDHLDCHSGPFRVVLVCTCCSEVFTFVYSSDAGVWSEPTSAPLRRARVHLAPSVHLENALYFMAGYGNSKVLKYDLGTTETSLIRLPRTPYKHIALMATMDDGLGFAGVHKSKLCLWSKPRGLCRMGTKPSH
ncbi:hypothetical protein ACP4OV_005053 [Aristida adscensionis]